MTRLRLLIVALLAVSTGLVLSLGLAGCGSSGTGRGEKVMDVATVEPSFSSLQVATSPRGKVAVAWESLSDKSIDMRELPASSWDWSKTQSIATGTSQSGGETVMPEGGLTLGYDGLGRLLVAWGVDLSHDRSGHLWGVKARLRGAQGRWQPAKLIARLPAKQSSGAATLDLRISSGKNEFAVAWSAGSLVADRPYPSLSGLRILNGNRWLRLAYVKEGSPAALFPQDRPPLALWIRRNGKLVNAPVRPDGSLGAIDVLAKADGFLTATSSEMQIVAAWMYNAHTWAATWNGSQWSSPQRLAANGWDGSQQSPLAATAAPKQAAVTWLDPGFGAGGSFAVTKPAGTGSVWSKPSPLSSDSNAGNVWAGSLMSGRIVLLTSRGARDRLEITSILPSQQARHSAVPLGDNIGLEAFASGDRALAYAWETQSEAPTAGSLHVWVLRP